MIFEPVFRHFENWIRPFTKRQDLRPPEGTWAFAWYYVGQAKLAFAAMGLLGGAVAILEAALFWFVGRLVDLIDTVPKEAGWQGLIDSHGPELLGMFLAVLVGRFVVVTLNALVEEQAVELNFVNLVRWQAYSHVARQSLSFFQNDFAGRIVTKVWSAGQANRRPLHLAAAGRVVHGDLYGLDHGLVGQLDWRLSAIILVWVVIFVILARYFVPRIRHHARETAEAASMLNGRMVDSFGNIQTLKLFGREDQNDHYIRSGFDLYRDKLRPFARLLTSVRAALALLSGVMIVMVAALSVDLWFTGAITSGGLAFTLGPRAQAQHAAGTHDDAAQRHHAQYRHDPELGGTGVAADRADRQAGCRAA